MELNAKALRLRRGQSYKLRVTRMNVGDRVKSFTSSKKGVASVDKRGRVTGKKAGKAVITVILESGARATVSVTVRGGTVRTKKITVQKKSVTLKPRKTFQIKAKVTPASSTQKVTYQSSNKKVATVTKKGKIRARKKGSAVITVKSGTKKVKVKVRVK
ncbi:MAG: Ig-like domain-containing protein [Eubacteriales bacterium]|nr:Ig-like domain-containing protein [Eubacteriales bacterium]